MVLLVGNNNPVWRLRFEGRCRRMRARAGLRPMGQTVHHVEGGNCRYIHPHRGRNLHSTSTPRGMCWGFSTSPKIIFYTGRYLACKVDATSHPKRELKSHEALDTTYLFLHELRAIAG